MKRAGLGLKVVEAYRTWSQWLVTLDFAGIGAVVFLYSSDDRGNLHAIPPEAMVVLLLFGISILAASMVVGNHSSVVERICDPDYKTEHGEELKITDIRKLDCNVPITKWKFRNPLWVVSMIGGLTFSFGAVILALATVFR